MIQHTKIIEPPIVCNYTLPVTSIWKEHREQFTTSSMVGKGSIEPHQGQNSISLSNTGLVVMAVIFWSTTQSTDNHILSFFWWKNKTKLVVHVYVNICVYKIGEQSRFHRECAVKPNLYGYSLVLSNLNWVDKFYWNSKVSVKLIMAFSQIQSIKRPKSTKMFKMQKKQST